MTVQPKNRWLRFSLRTMLVIVMVACLLLASKVRQAERQKIAVAWVKKMGGDVAYDYQPKIGTIFWLDVHRPDEPPGPRWLVELIGVDYFSTVAGVRLDGSQVTDLTPLTSLSRLKDLNLERTVADLTPLAKLNELETLRLRGLKECDLSPVVHLPNLRELALEETEVDLAQLAQMTKLETLRLASLRVRDCSALDKVPNLRMLYLFSVKSAADDFDDCFATFQRSLPNCRVSRYSLMTIIGNRSRPE